jgi:hypothetical protein
MHCVSVVDGRRYNCRKWICATGRELDRALQEWDEQFPLLVQRFMYGTGEGVFGLAAPGGVRALSSHRRLRMMNPQGSGSSACISQAAPRELEPKVSTLVADADWRGLFMIELLRDRVGKLWFIEINGRPWGSMALARRQGLEYPAWHVNLAIDPRSQAGASARSAPGLVCRHIGREFMHLLFVLKGPKSIALNDWPSIWQTMSALITVDRAGGVYNWRRDDPKVFIADCYYTVHQNLFKAKH